MSILSVYALQTPRCFLEPLYTDLLTFLFGSSEIWILETLLGTILIIPTFYQIDHSLFSILTQRILLIISSSTFQSLTNSIWNYLDHLYTLNKASQLSLFSAFSQHFLLLFNLESYKVNLIPILNISTLLTNVPMFHEPIYKTLPTYTLRLLYNIELLSQVRFFLFWMSKRSELQPLTWGLRNYFSLRVWL